MTAKPPRITVLLLTTALIGLSALLPQASALASDDDRAAASAANAPGTWVDHKYSFHFMGFTSTYSCIGLMDKLRLVLQTSGARVQKLSPLCSNGQDRPDRLAQVDIRFATLQPEMGASSAGAAGASSAGVWKHVQLAPRHPYDLQDGDCELIDQFRAVLLPMFATRDVSNKTHCVPNQDLGPFSLSFEVFAPAAGSAGPK